MNRPPYFPFYVKDFISDPNVELMSTTAVGAYILLLCRSWHLDPPASLPDDDRQLARWARMTADEWTEVRPEVLLAFTLGTDSRLHQKRLRQEYERFKARSYSASENGKKGGRKSEGKAAAKQQLCDSKARASGSVSDSGSESSPIPKGECEGETLPAILDTEQFHHTWANWQQHHREIKKPITPKSRTMALKKLEAMGHDRAIAAIEHSIANGWQGIFEPDSNRAGTSATPRGGQFQSGRLAQAERRAAMRRRDFEEPDTPIPDPFAKPKPVAGPAVEGGGSDGQCSLTARNTTTC